MNKIGILFWIFLGLYLLRNEDVYSQNTVLDIFKLARNYADTLDKLNIEIENIDFNVLTLLEKSEETRRSFSPDYSYIIVGYGNENIDKLKLELFEPKEGEWSYLKQGNSLSKTSYISSLEFTPEKEMTCMIRVTAEEFAKEASGGRYFIAIGKELSAITVNSYSRVSVKMNINTGKISTTGKAEYTDCIFKIYGDKIEQYINKNLSQTFNIIELTSSEETIKNGNIIYSVQDTYGYNYAFYINTLDKLISIYQSSQRDNILTGWVYTVDNN
jgi:hypothetical protein